MESEGSAMRLRLASPTPPIGPATETKGGDLACLYTRLPPPAWFASRHLALLGPDGTRYAAARHDVFLWRPSPKPSAGPARLASFFCLGWARPTAQRRRPHRSENHRRIARAHQPGRAKNASLDLTFWHERGVANWSGAPRTPQGVSATKFGGCCTPAHRRKPNNSKVGVAAGT